MRVTKFLIPFLIALAAAGCARQQQASYVIDPATGQPVPVLQQYSSPQYGYAQAGYQAGYQADYAQAAPQPAYAQASRRGLYTARARNAAPAYAAPAYAQAYPPPAAEPQAAPSSSRGLFGSHGAYQSSSGRGVFNSPRAYAQPQYAQSYPYQSYVLQYHPPAAAPAPQPYAAAPYGYGYGYAYAPSTYDPSYTLDSGDKLRVVVFGQQGISGSYAVDAGGNVTLPLAGTIPARHFTTRQVAKEITDRLKQGYVREPHVTVTIEAYRPFFILGEVTTPGQYPYVPNMTVEKAIAVAGGFAPRAQKQTVEITRNTGGQRFTSDVPLGYPMRPGDTIVVKERWF
jgi:polysaccharide export outer membrane protein